jgi:DNA-binding NarL/FixJ family response regulator
MRQTGFAGRKTVQSAASLIRILTVDDHPLLRKGIAALVNAEPDLKLIAEASNGKEAIDAFRSHRPDITLMDLQMPSVDGLQAIEGIRTEFPDARIIVLTTYSGDMQVLRALKAGARGYILKGHVHKELLDTIRAVHAGQKRIPPDIAAELADHTTDDLLTAREIDVLRLIATGNSNKQIADHLSIGEATVKSHVTNILSKLGANDRAHAVTIGLKRGIIELDPPQK